MAVPKFADRVLETTTGTGTGALTLAGAVAGFQSFNSGVGNGASFFYFIEAVDADGNPSGDWEVGRGTYTHSGTSLARDSIIASSNSGSAVNWGAGTKRVGIAFTSRTAVHAEAGYAPTQEGELGYDTTLAALVAGGHGAIKGFVHRIVRQQVDTTDTLTASTIGTTETAFTKKFTIPANFLKVGKGLRVTLLLKFTSSSSSPTLALRVKAGGVGGTTIYANNGVAWTNSVTNRGLGFEFVVLGTAAPGASVAVVTEPLEGVALGGAAIGFSANGVDSPQNLATNGSLDLVTTVQYGANTAGNSITLLGLLVEELTGD